MHGESSPRSGMGALASGSVALGAEVLHYLEVFKDWPWVHPIAVVTAASAGGLGIVLGMIWVWGSGVDRPVGTALTRLLSARYGDSDRFLWGRWKRSADQFAAAPKALARVAARGFLDRKETAQPTETLLRALLVAGHNGAQAFCPDAYCLIRRLDLKKDKDGKTLCDEHGKVVEYFPAIHVEVADNCARLETYLAAEEFQHRLGSFAGLAFDGRQEKAIVVSGLDSRSAEDVLKGLRDRPNLNRLISQGDAENSLVKSISKIKECGITSFAMAPIWKYMPIPNENGRLVKEPAAILEIVSLSRHQQLRDTLPITHAIANLTGLASVCIQLPLALCASIDGESNAPQPGRDNARESGGAGGGAGSKQM